MSPAGAGDGVNMVGDTFYSFMKETGRTIAMTTADTIGEHQR